jgi:hypothetical protein
MQNSISGSAASVAQSLAGVTTPTTSTTTLLSGVANLLGTTTDDLIKSLQGGQSLSDLASAKGVSRDDLLATIKQGVQANQTTTGQTTDLDAMAAKIADRKGLGHRHHEGGSGVQSGGESLQQRVADLSSALGVSDDELVQAIQNGLGSTGQGATSGYGVSTSLLQGLQIDQLA